MLTWMLFRFMGSLGLAQMAHSGHSASHSTQMPSLCFRPIASGDARLTHEGKGIMTLDLKKLEPLLGTMVNELGAAANAALVFTGDRLGLYRAMADGEPVTSKQLAAKTRTQERLIREWLSSQAASGFVTYDAREGTFSLSPEQAAVFADENSTFNMTGGFHSLAAVFADQP